MSLNGRLTGGEAEAESGSGIAGTFAAPEGKALMTGKSLRITGGVCGNTIFGGSAGIGFSSVTTVLAGRGGAIACEPPEAIGSADKRFPAGGVSGSLTNSGLAK